MSYVSMIALVTAVVLALALIAVAHAGIAGWMLWLLGIVGLVPASDVAIAVVNRAITQQIGAMRLPGLELRGGVPFRFAYHGRRADAAHQHFSDPAADRAARGSLPFQPGRQFHLRAAVRLARLRHRTHRG